MPKNLLMLPQSQYETCAICGQAAALMQVHGWLSCAGLKAAPVQRSEDHAGQTSMPVLCSCTLVGHACAFTSQDHTLL